MNMVFTHTCFRVFFPPRPPKPKAYWFFAVVYPPTPLSRGVLSCELEPLLQFAESAASKACERCASDRPMGAERFWGASWRPLVTLLERLWATKGTASGAPLGDLWMRFWGASQRPLMALLGRLWATNGGASGAPLGDLWRRFWAPLNDRLWGASWRPLTALLGRTPLGDL